MKLSDYPRPPADNGRGIHWSPSQYQWGRKNWRTWQKRILEMGLKWIKVNVPPDYNAEAIAKRLIDIEVMPVCRFIRENPTRIDGAIEKSIERLVALGVRYFETNNEPDADIEWENFHRPDGWEEIVIKNLIYDANRIHNIGGIPALVAFNSGPKEPRNAIQILLQQPGGREVLDKGLWISLHNYGKGRPFNYPNDRVRMFGDPISEEDWLKQKQPDFWTAEETVKFSWHGATREEVNRLRQAQKNPNITIMQDITCFRAFEYWNTLVTQEGLTSIPIMMTEGGWETGDRIDPFYPEPTAQQASDLNYQMYQFMQGDIEMTINKPDGSTESYPVPDYFFAVMPWHMGEKAFGADTSGQWEQGAWFTNWHDKKFGLNGELPIIQMLRDLTPSIRADGPTPPEWQKRSDLTPHFNIEDNNLHILKKFKGSKLKVYHKIAKRFAHWHSWDHRFLYLEEGIGFEKAEQLADGSPTWQLIKGIWQDKNERNDEETLPPGYIMVRVLDEVGNPIPDASIAIERSDTVDVIKTKGQFDNFLGNYKMSGTLGTYSIKVTHQGYPSDQVHNVGIGGEEDGSGFDETSFLFVFQLTVPAKTPSANKPSDATTTTDVTSPIITASMSPSIGAKATTLTVDNDALNLGVKVWSIDSGADYTVVTIHHYTTAENMAPSTLYLDVLDKNGQRLYGSVVLLEDINKQLLRVTIEKPETEPGGNTPLWPYNCFKIIGLEVNGKQLLGDVVNGLQSSIKNQGEGHSFLVVLQLT